MILGIDPGYGRCGYAFVEKKGNAYKIIEASTIYTHKDTVHARRLLEIYNELDRLIKEYQPRSAAIEELFFSKNTKTAMQVAEARGAILLVFAKNALEYEQYKPREIKLSITGNGNAAKDAVIKMVSMFTGIDVAQDDCADAVAVAITHASSMKNRCIGK